MWRLLGQWFSHFGILESDYDITLSSSGFFNLSPSFKTNAKWFRTYQQTAFVFSLLCDLRKYLVLKRFKNIIGWKIMTMIIIIWRRIRRKVMMINAQSYLGFLCKATNFTCSYYIHHVEWRTVRIFGRKKSYLYRYMVEYHILKYGVGVYTTKCIIWGLLCNKLVNLFSVISDIRC